MDNQNEVMRIKLNHVPGAAEVKLESLLTDLLIRSYSILTSARL